MSQTKNSRSKRILLPTEISVSLKTPKSKYYLFPTGPLSSNSNRIEYGNENNSEKKSKRKKLRRTQNCFNFSGETNEESSSSFSSVNKLISSTNSEFDGDISPDPSAIRIKSKKSKKKKGKLPTVNLDDFGNLENIQQNSSPNISNEKIASIESSNSNEMDVLHQNKRRKRNKRKLNLKNIAKKENEIKPERKSSRKNHKDEISNITKNKENLIDSDGSAVNIVTMKKRRRNKKMQSIDKTEDSEGTNEKQLKIFRKDDSDENDVNSELTDVGRPENVMNSTSSISSKKTIIVNSENNAQKETLMNSGKSRRKKGINQSRNSKSCKVANPELTGGLKDNAIENSKPSRKKREKSISQFVSKYGEADTKELQIGRSTTTDIHNHSSNTELSAFKDTSGFAKNKNSISEQDPDSDTFIESTEKQNMNISINFLKSTPVKHENFRLEGTSDKLNIKKPIILRKSYSTFTPKIENVEDLYGSTNKDDRSTENMKETSRNFKTLKTEENDKNTKKEDAIHPRKAWQISYTEDSGRCEKFETNIDSSDVRIPQKMRPISTLDSSQKALTALGKSSSYQNERKSWQIKNPAIIHEIEVSGEHSKRSSICNSKIFGISNENPSFIYTDESEKVDENIKKLNAETPVRRNSRISSPKISCRSEEISNCHAETSEFCRKKSDADLEPESLANASNDSSKLFLDRNKSMNEGKKRKRWAIMNNGDVEESSSSVTLGDNETSKKVFINSNQLRRSTRKRWSSELRKNVFESQDVKVEEVINSPIISQVTLEESAKIDNDNSLQRSRYSNISRISGSSTKDDYSIEQNSTFIQNQSDCVSSEKETFTLSMKESNNFTADPSMRRNSKRYSKSFDCLKGIGPLESSTLGDEDATWNEFSVFNRKPSTPGPVLKRRGTYEVDVSATNISILKSLSEDNLPASTNVDKSEKTANSVRLQHVTRRKPQVNQDNSCTPESKKEGSTTKKKHSKLGTANKSASFDQTMFSSSSCSTSTPLNPSKKDNLLKQTLRKNLSNTSNKRRSRSVDNKKENVVSKIRMPNFSKIHQRWNDKLENISEMTARKAERARMLLSGQKPTSTSYRNESQNKNKNDNIKHPKHLVFSSQQSTSVAEGICLSSVDNKKDMLQTNELGSSKKQIVLEQNSIGKTISAKSKKFPTKSGIPKKLEIKKPANMVQRSEEIKSLVTKTKPQHDAKEDRRNILKGVRGNRRFELLMKMRNKCS